MRRSVPYAGQYYTRLSWLMLLLCSWLILAASWPTAAAAYDKIGAAGPGAVGSGQSESPYAPLIINDSTIDSAIQRYSPFVLDCWEEGCVPCQLISPTVDEMAQDFKGKVIFGKLRTDQNHKTRFKYHIYHYPVLLIFKNGSLVYNHLGNYPKAELESMILEKLGMK
jgi:thioredoxin 1